MLSFTDAAPLVLFTVCVSWGEPIAQGHDCGRAADRRATRLGPGTADQILSRLVSVASGHSGWWRGNARECHGVTLRAVGASCGGPIVLSFSLFKSLSVRCICTSVSLYMCLSVSRFVLVICFVSLSLVFSFFHAQNHCRER